MGRYLVRVFSDQEQNGATVPGTVVVPMDIQLSFYTDSADDAEKKLYTDVLKGKLAKGRVYQICPSMVSFEPIRTCAIAPDGSAHRVFLDPVGGLYSQSRRIRLPRENAAEREPELALEIRLPK
jgi:hypothetical protein